MTTMKRRQWLGNTAGALGFATLAPQTQANSGAPRVVTVESALRPLGFGLPQRAALSGDAGGGNGEKAAAGGCDPGGAAG